MLNRRHIRIKVLQILYAFFHSSEKNKNKFKIELDKSFNSSKALFFHFIKILLELCNYSKKKLDFSYSKLRKEELNLINFFTESKIINITLKDSQLQKNLKDQNFYLNENNKILSEIFEKLSTSAYLNSSIENFRSSNNEDLIIIKILEDFIIFNENIQSTLNERNIYWVDDYIMINNCLKIFFKSIVKNKLLKIPPIFKNNEDVLFSKKLFSHSISNSKYYDKLIVGISENWDQDRISDMDLILLKMALTELTHFSSIPVKVSLNEYIELSKDYSSKKSKIFINGILDKLVEKLLNEGEIKKLGRGLIQ
tara:strand:+ start:3176 stop:4105 length:930 start_codon:yes stop_codon:yes gene_type:complete